MKTYCLRPADLSIELIANRLNAIQPAPSAVQSANRLRQAAVLIPILCEGEQWRLLFIRRTDQVQDHKGQVSFPGGAFEPVDTGLEATALRETDEEIGISPQDIQVLGRMPVFATVSGYAVTPVVGQIPWPIPLKLAPAEVSRVFTIPVEWLANQANWSERPYTRSNGRTEKVIFYEHFDGELLWGITAKITIDFLELMGLIKERK